jgi:hypothetical protein
LLSLALKVRRWFLSPNGRDWEAHRNNECSATFVRTDHHSINLLHCEVNVCGGNLWRDPEGNFEGHSPERLINLTGEGEGVGRWTTQEIGDFVVAVSVGGGLDLRMGLRHGGQNTLKRNDRQTVTDICGENDRNLWGEKWSNHMDVSIDSMHFSEVSAS